MKIAILQCNGQLPEVQSQEGLKKDMIRGMFNPTCRGFEFENFDCQQEHYPHDIDHYDFYIITGSKAGVYENWPWIHRLVKYVRLLGAREKKVIGICFGHQIIAMACGGMVEKSEKGWGLGVAVNHIVSSPEWMSETKNELNLLVSHQDQITRLPENASVVAESDFCPFFVVQWNDHFLSTQGHPEWDRTYSRDLMNRRRGIIPSEQIEMGLGSLHLVPDNSLFVRWIIDFVRH